MNELYQKHLFLYLKLHIIKSSWIVVSSFTSNNHVDTTPFRGLRIFTFALKGGGLIDQFWPFLPNFDSFSRISMQKSPPGGGAVAPLGPLPYLRPWQANTFVQIRAARLPNGLMTSRRLIWRRPFTWRVFVCACVHRMQTRLTWSHVSTYNTIRAKLITMITL